MSTPRLLLAPLLPILFALAACGPAAPAASPTPPPGLTPYASPSATQPAPPAEQPTPAAPVVLPSPTPFVYVVRAGDTLLGIALQFGITLDDLQAANPTIDPRFLSVDTPLVIPLDGVAPPAAGPTPDVRLLTLAAPACHASATGGLWCLAVAANPGPQTLENLEIALHLLDGNGARLASETAFIALNILPAGESLVVAAYFSAPPAGWQSAAAEVLAVLPLADAAGRYLPVALEGLQTALHPNGRSGTLTGTLALPADSAPASQVWLAVLGWDAEGNPAAVRRWESPAGLAPGATLAFEVALYSAGPPLASITVLAEARP